mgnify:CR=1 FL=1
MSLLVPDHSARFQALVDAAFQCEKEANPEYYTRISPKTERNIYRDTRYNIDYLCTAYLLKEEKILTDYAAWLYQLLASILGQRFQYTPEKTAQYTLEHFGCIKKAVARLPEEDARAEMLHLMDKASDAVREAAAKPLPKVPQVPSTRYEDQIQAYMTCLLHKDSRQAILLVQQFVNSGIPLNDMYVEILAESMRRVGELWHTCRITVDTEHYCTSVTQMAMAQLYPALFAKKRRGRSILLACRDVVLAIRKAFPSAKIAVGGKAFESTNDLWERWPIDLHAFDARDFLQQANALFA